MKTWTRIQLAAAVVGTLVCLTAAYLNFCQGHYGLSSCMSCLAVMNIGAAGRALRL